MDRRRIVVYKYFKYSIRASVEWHGCMQKALKKHIWSSKGARLLKDSELRKLTVAINQINKCDRNSKLTEPVNIF